MAEETNLVTVEPQEAQIAETTQNAPASPFLSADTFQQLFDIGKMFASSELVPRAYQGKPMNCAIAIDIANRMNVSPMFVMQNMWPVQGMPTWSGQACMAIIRASKRYSNVKVVQTGEKFSDSWGCYIEATDTQTGATVRGTEVTMAMAKKEGWYGKNGSKWQTMPEQMLQYRAAAFFARVYTPNELMGFSVEGEPEDIAKPEKTAVPDVRVNRKGSA